MDFTAKKIRITINTYKRMSADFFIEDATGFALGSKARNALTNSERVQASERKRQLKKAINGLHDPGAYVAKDGYHYNKYDNQQVSVAFDEEYISLATNIPTNVPNRAVRQVKWDGTPDFAQFAAAVAQLKAENKMKWSRVKYVDAATGKQTDTMDLYFQIFIQGVVC